MSKVRSASEMAYSKIREKLLDGTFSPNARLKEFELVELCGVSRTPIREALHRLAAENFVLINRNQGAQVKGWSKENLDELFALRAMLEGYAAAQAAQNITAEQMIQLGTDIEKIDEALVSNLPFEGIMQIFLDLNIQFHEAIWVASKGTRLIEILKHLVDQASVAHTASKFSLERLQESHSHHRQLLKALQTRDSQWAESIMKNHILAARPLWTQSGLDPI
ncbi:GntR family transcriptional regulator [Haliea sp. E1-2-M8]|uniref:GntR family transcriptional regulator n=1 Tax=Haliea sp. E1-2-M8 TaxID=3064706 RepID=UPI0027279EED|nr:GntR family transcriptional regulator [Haliea sp. E1-2-M8]MDO8864184.1 GntR family transcriptional regulator [Haliea sp. E1-2-M8]